MELLCRSIGNNVFYILKFETIYQQFQVKKKYCTEKEIFEVEDYNW